MFRKRRTKDASVQRSSPISVPRQQDLATSSTARSTPRPALSPVRVDSDFGLPSPAFGDDLRRPQTSDGIGTRTSNLPLTPPVLPPIPRVSSHSERHTMDLLTERETNEHAPNSAVYQYSAKDKADYEQRVIQQATEKFMDMRPSTSAGDGSSGVKMQSSLFPTRAPLPPLDTDAPMSRAWIDARDKPYQAANSSPDLQNAANRSTPTIPSRNPLASMSGNTNSSPTGTTVFFNREYQRTRTTTFKCGYRLQRNHGTEYAFL